MARNPNATLRSLRSRSVHYFLTLYETRSITQAAEQLCITQPALSNNLRALESQLGVPLFERTPQGLFPTPFAEALFRRARNAEVELTLAVDEMAQIGGAETGTVRAGVGASVISICAGFLPGFLAAHPRLDVGVIEGPAEQLFRQVGAGEVDFAILTAPRADEHPDLDVRLVASLATVAMVRAGHPLAGRDVSRAMLRDYPWVVADRALETSTSDLLAMLQAHLPGTILSTNSPALMRMVIGRSDFIGFMPETILADQEYGGGLRALDLEGGLYERNLMVLTRRRSHLPPPSALFLDQLLKVILDSAQEKIGSRPAPTARGKGRASARGSAAKAGPPDQPAGARRIDRLP